LLASVPEGLVTNALAALGIDTERLARTLDEGRAGGPRPARHSTPEIRAEIEETRAEKDSAIEAREFERAANLRDHERRLTNKARDADGGRLQNGALLAKVRAHLGLDEH